MCLTVLSNGIQNMDCSAINFKHMSIKWNITNIKRLLIKVRPDAIIFWTDPKIIMLPIYMFAKLFRIKMIHWGHRRPIAPIAFIRKVIYNCEHWMDDAIILYSEHLREHVWRCFREKTFVANNTLNLTGYEPSNCITSEVKKKYGITTSKNIIFMGRIQPRKRIDDLTNAFQMLNLQDTGLIIAGPDPEGILQKTNGRNIYKVGALYGKESLDLLTAADVYCIPGAIGLSIVDAFYCGVPVVTEDVIHGPEIMYLIDGVNGFMVPEGNVELLASRLNQILTDDVLRVKFSQAARNEIMTRGHIDRMCEGFVNALHYALGQR